MNNRVASAAAIAALFMLSSCGGEDGPTGPTGGTPTPSPTATPTPTPTPTPTFSYETYDQLTGDQNFFTACVEFGPSGGRPPVGLLSNRFDLPGTIAYTAATDSWTVKSIDNAFTQTFTPADIVRQSSEETLYEVATTGQVRSFNTLTPMINGTAATYARGALYVVGESGLCSFGVQTDPDDEPATTTVVYDQVGIGGVYIENNPSGSGFVTGEVVGGSGTITGNVETGEVNISLFITRRDATGADITIGPIEFPAFPAVGADAAGYAAANDPSGVYGITLSGGFYGPQGIETGFVLVLNEIDTVSGGAERSYIIGGLGTR